MDNSLKQGFLLRWKKYFGDAPLPIALFYSDVLNDAEPARKSAGHRCMIADISRVFKGETLAFNNSNMGCAGGKRYCGFSNTIRPGFEYFLSYGIEGEMEGERYKNHPDTVIKLIKNTPTLKAPAAWLIAKPFEKLQADDQPGVILFFTTPDVLSGLFTLANYDRTDLFGVKAPFSAGCGSIIQYGFDENKREYPDCIMGMFDVSARPYVKAGTLSFAIPFKRFETLAGYMDESFLITRSWKTVEKRISAGITSES